MTQWQTPSGSHIQPLRSDAEVEDRLSQLKLLAGLLPKPSDRARCLAELLNARSRQLAAHIAGESR